MNSRESSEEIAFNNVVFPGSTLLVTPRKHLSGVYRLIFFKRIKTQIIFFLVSIKST